MMVGMCWRAAVTRPVQPEGSRVLGTTCVQKVPGKEGRGIWVEKKEHEGRDLGWNPSSGISGLFELGQVTQSL